VGTPRHLYGEEKLRRTLYLTETAHRHLVDLANGNGTSPSQICEQIIRHHATAAALSTYNQTSSHG